MKYRVLGAITEPSQWFGRSGNKPKRKSSELRVERETSYEVGKLSKQLEKMKTFMKVKGLTEFLDDSDDEDLNLKKATPVAYKMPKFSLYNGMGNPRVHLMQYKSLMEISGSPPRDIVKMFPLSLAGAAQTWDYNLDKKKTRDWNELSALFLKEYRVHSNPSSSSCRDCSTRSVLLQLKTEG